MNVCLASEVKQRVMAKKMVGESIAAGKGEPLPFPLTREVKKLRKSPLCTAAI